MLSSPATGINIFRASVIFHPLNGCRNTTTSEFTFFTSFSRLAFVSISFRSLRPSSRLLQLCTFATRSISSHGRSAMVVSVSGRSPASNEAFRAYCVTSRLDVSRLSMSSFSVLGITIDRSRTRPTTGAPVSWPQTPSTPHLPGSILAAAQAGSNL